jgi:DNA mismatch endonuclease (patch repair protein)
MDKLSPQKRSWLMGRIKSKDTKLEVAFREAFWSKGFRYRKNSLKYFGKPDIVLKKYKTVVFLDSCFWHGCKKHFRMPATRKEYWKTKIARNRERDEEVNLYYKNMGWKVFRFWEHDIEKNLDKTMAKITDFLNDRKEKEIEIKLQIDSRKCAKRHVIAIIEKDGKYYVGSDWCRNPQKECPRLPGEDYSKCKTICKQDGHAELDAIKNAKGDTKGGIMYLIGHDHSCEPCLAAMKKAGIETVVFNKYPKGFQRIK